MHRLADSIERAITVSFLHIADATAAAIRERDIGTVALLGTRYTMEQPFYRDRLASHEIEVMVPRQHGRAAVHHVGVVPVDPACGRLGIVLDPVRHAVR
jgi:aspartate racemase